MEKQELIQQANRLKSLKNTTSVYSQLAEVREFFRIYTGSESEFYKLVMLPTRSLEGTQNRVESALNSFIRFVENGLFRSISLEREIKLETVSDYMDQALTLLNDKNVHAAAPAVLIGASLEEFLRTWLEEEKFDLTTIKNSLDAYTQELIKLGLINKQDSKDIISWAGIRNDAAHGHFDAVNDKKRIKIMLEGVNLFIRKYTPG